MSKDASLRKYYEDTKTKAAPKGWEAGITWNGSGGTLTTGALEGEPDAAIWRELIADWGLDPNVTEVVPGTVQVRGWDGPVAGGGVQRLRYYRCSLRPRADAEDRADVDALCAAIAKRKPVAVKRTVSSDRSLVVLLSDWQIGKGEGGGSPALIDRVLERLQLLKGYLKELRKVGRSPDAIYLVGLGDLVEGCSQFYAMQEFQTDLDRRSQKRVGRRLLLAFVDELLPFGRLVLGSVAGNHGENRRKGKAYTTFADNADLELFEEIAEVLAANPERYANVSVPSGAIADDLTMTLDISGVTCGFAHGHQMTKGVGAQMKTENWWATQALGFQPVSTAQLLFKGHLHHFVVSEATGRTMFQCPALDGGSYWYTSTSGQNSPAGMLVVGVGTAYGVRGWGDLVIL